MEKRLLPEEITYAHAAILNTGDGRVVAGVRLAKRAPEATGTVRYEPYAVLSLHYDSRDVPTVSTRQVLPLIIKDIIRNVDSQTRLISVRGNVPHFMRYRQLEQHIRLFAASHNVATTFVHKKGIEHSIPELKDLANDALRRGESLVAII